MEFTTFVRKPFTVQAVEVTVDNIAEIAKSVGALQYKDDGSPFILVDRDRVPNVLQVSPGFWMTKMGNNIRCYTRKAFYNQFCENTPDIQTWVDFMNNRSEGTEEQAS